MELAARISLKRSCLSTGRTYIWIALLATLLGGKAAAAELIVSQVTPISGQDGAQARAYAAGMRLQFEAVNRGGGINGHTLQLLSRDDAGRPEDTLSLTKQAIAEDKPIVLAGYFGGRNVAELAATGVLEREKLVLVGYRTSEIAAEPPHVFSVRAGPREEVRKIVEHLATIGISRIGLLHEAGGASTTTVAYVEAVTREFKVQLSVRGSYPAGTNNVGNAVSEFMMRPPQAIIMLSGGAASAAFVEQYRSIGGVAQLFAYSGSGLEELSRNLSEEQTKGLAIAQVTPSPYRIATRLSREFQEAVKSSKLEVPVSYAMMEGFLTARVIVEAIRRQGGNPSRVGTMKALESMGDFDAGGLFIKFQPGQRTGSRYVELSIMTGAGRIRQ